MIWRLVEAIGPLLSDRRYFAILERLALQARQRSRAKFIGITGSSAKSTSTALLAHILAARGRVHEQVEFNLLRHLYRTLARLQRRYDFVVVEAGALRPGQMKLMAEVLRPDVVVATLIGLEHKSAFHTREALAAEKAELVAALRPGGLAVLNADDDLVMDMAQRTRARIVTFGRSDKADFRATDISGTFPERLSLTVVWPGGALPLRTNFVGEHFWLPTLAAAAAAIELGVLPKDVASRVATFEPLLERCGVLSIPNGPHFILDTKKAPWHSVQLAIDVVAHASAPRKRIVLGHMSDYPGSNQSKYRSFYRWARAAADQVVFVGNHAHRSGASQEDRDGGHFVSFATPRQVAEHIRDTAVPGELILLKGSVDLHLERIALAWTKNVKCWVPACGKLKSCTHCGLFEIPYEQHKRPRRASRGGTYWKLR